jgi:hypothetical protein
MCVHPRSGKQGNPAFPPGIESIRIQTVYYTFMRKRALSLLLTFAISSVASFGQTPHPTTPPARTEARDSHEGMTILVDPWTVASRYKERFPKKSPFNGGVIAFHVTFQNESDDSIQLDLKSIRLLLFIGEDNRQELITLTADDVADTVLLKNSSKDPTQRRNPLPIPVGRPTPSRDKNWTELRDAAQNAGVPSNVVAAHSSVEGLLYFDLRGEIELLQTARLYVPNLITMSNRRPLSYFDIELGHSTTN